MPENTGFNDSNSAAAELTPDPGAQRRELTAECLGRDGKWYRMDGTRALNGQPEAVSGKLDAILATGNKNLPEKGLNIYGLPLGWGPKEWPGVPAFT